MQATLLSHAEPTKPVSLSHAAPAGGIVLARDRVLRLEGDRRGTRIACRRGTLWITQEGDGLDYTVFAGQEFTVNRRGVVLIQALEEAAVGVG